MKREVIEVPQDKSVLSGSSNVWIEVLRIESTDIAFTIPSKNPENIYFLQMEEI